MSQFYTCTTNIKRTLIARLGLWALKESRKSLRATVRGHAEKAGHRDLATGAQLKRRLTEKRANAKLAGG